MGTRSSFPPLAAAGLALLACDANTSVDVSEPGPVVTRIYRTQPSPVGGAGGEEANANGAAGSPAGASSVAGATGVALEPL